VGETDAGQAETGNTMNMDFVTNSGGMLGDRSSAAWGAGDGAGAHSIWLTGLVLPHAGHVGNIRFAFLMTGGIEVGLGYYPGSGVFDWQLFIGGTRFDTDVPLAFDETIKVVLQYDFSGNASADTVKLWINPGSDLDDPPLASLSANFGSITAVRLASATGGAYDVSMDEIQVHDSAPVAPLISSVPEPSTAVLAGLGVAGLALGAWRRRKLL